MKSRKIVIMILGLLGLFTLLYQPLAALEESALEFIPTQNAPPGIKGTMTVKVDDGKSGTKVEFKLRDAYPNTVYTLWTVFSLLKESFPTERHEVPSIPASTRPGFPPLQVLGMDEIGQ